MLGVGASKEYQVKAAFLYNFTKFVEWPPETLGADGEPIVIAVLGKNPFGGELENVVRERKVNGRSITILAAKTPAELARAHIVFVAAGQEALFESLAAGARQPMLTVGESDRFADLGGIVRFTTVGDKVRFEINVGPADEAGLKISAQLQKLATVVHRKS